LAGRDDVLLEPILRLLLKYVADPRFGVMVADIAGVVIGEILLSPDPTALMLFSLLDMYRPVIGQAPLVDALFVRLRKKVAAEIRFQQEIMKVKGALTMVLASATTYNS
jgi:U3 small nucleolar RNA-associated protein 15